MKKKIKSGLIGLGGILLTAFISSVLNAWFSNINILESFINILESFLKFVIFLYKSDLGVFILFFIGCVIIYKKLQKINKEITDINLRISRERIDEIIYKIDDLSSYNRKLRETANKIIKINKTLSSKSEKFKEFEEIKYREKIYFLLLTVAEQPNEKIKKKDAENYFQRNFNEKSFKNFNIVWTFVIEDKLLIQCQFSTDSSMEAFKLTSKGYDYLRYYEFKYETEN